MIKKLVIGIFLMLALATITLVPTTLANPKHYPFVTDLISGQNIDVRDVEVWDEHAVPSTNNLQLSNGMLVLSIHFYLLDVNGATLNSDALPTTAAVLAD